MKINRPLIAGAVCVLALSSTFLASCRWNPLESHDDVVTVTADATVVNKLGITVRPIVDSTARLIADAASSGKSISSNPQITDGISYFDVQEAVGTLTMDVKVRTSDGAIITIQHSRDVDSRH